MSKKNKKANEKTVTMTETMNTPSVPLTQDAIAVAPPSKPNTKIRLLSEDGRRVLILAKRVGKKNGAIRVYATISIKGQKPQGVGRQTLTSHDEANTALAKLESEALSRGWKRNERKAYVAKKDEEFAIPESVEVVEEEEEAVVEGA